MVLIITVWVDELEEEECVWLLCGIGGELRDTS